MIKQIFTTVEPPAVRLAVTSFSSSVVFKDSLKQQQLPDLFQLKEADWSIQIVDGSFQDGGARIQTYNLSVQLHQQL